ncbi:DUF2625 family protein [Myceligenerans indicum]|uniref:DUF2625 family protein n=1 Tax=Myceligenerans indicum TaxID=2593663 RepID=A0ABS1LNI6_9MICO|nr:DUF2625 family protein [Myceligenerans indicum]MBL0887644.1 DUF2625 family protein [Myceligenerans indicum]
MRSFEDPTFAPRPMWPELERLIGRCPVPVDQVPLDTQTARHTLEHLQVSTETALGAFVAHSGGLWVDHGWLRIYGSPSRQEPTRLPGLATMNWFPRDAAEPSPVHGLVVGHDVLGGAYVLNGHQPEADGRPGQPGEMLYFAPDALRWEELGASYADWLAWVLDDGLRDFSAGLRWQGWESEVSDLTGDLGINLFPPLWSEEAHTDLGATTRTAVPLSELVDIARETAEQLNGGGVGSLGRFEGSP